MEKKNFPSEPQPRVASTAPRARRPTLRDVAAKAGVSVAAVAATLSGGATTVRVSPATKQRIQQAAEELGYRPHAVARSLGRGRSDLIGISTGLSPFNVDTPFVAHLLVGLQRGCAQHGRDLLLTRQVTSGGATVQHTVDALCNGLVDGAVVLCSADDPALLGLRRRGLPLVAVADAIPGVPSVVGDDRAGGAALARHLHTRGHRRILYRRPLTMITSVQRRHEAFVAETTTLGGEVTSILTDFAAPGLSSADLRLIGGRRGATAIACFSDHDAWPTLASLAAAGLSVPNEVAVCGYDGIELYFDRPARWDLTTVRAGWDEVARVAIGVLTRLIEGDPVPPETVVPVALHQGATT